MSSYCSPKKPTREQVEEGLYPRVLQRQEVHVLLLFTKEANSPWKWTQNVVKGAPEGVLDRCTYVRIGAEKVPMTEKMREKIMARAIEYGTGRDTLRCLCLATADSPMDPKDMDLDNSAKFVNYEVN